ncbi:MAG TPA: hypothetical protein VL048_19250 [Xanthobacteraceae bacterium]|nr:hypothetical protein [Xanthobacteraceae bacterium]
MYKLLAVLVGLVICSAAQAQTITDPDSIVQQLKLWNQGDPDPVYYGEMTDERGIHMACLELAFIKYEDHVLHYIHKMWAKHNDSCEYTDQTTHKVDNSPLCVVDSNKPSPLANTTTLLTKQNIDLAHSVFREMDFSNRRAGQLSPCQGQTMQQAKQLGYLGSAGIVSVKIESGQFKMQSTAKRIYRVRLQPMDPRHPPTDKVF